MTLGFLPMLGIAIALMVWALSGWDAHAWHAAGKRALEIAQGEAALVEHLAHRFAGKVLQERAGGGVALGEVSEMIDIVRLGLSAGLSFDASLALFCEGRDGLLAERMSQARLSWQTGAGSREEELMAAAHDLKVRPLESFSTAVGQALELGAPLAETLLGQSREIRAAHRATVERQIERAPVKLLIPTGTLILPALLLSILGPLLAAGGML